MFLCKYQKKMVLEGIKSCRQDWVWEHNAYNSSIQENEAGALQVQNQPSERSEFKANLSYTVRPYFKNQETKQTKTHILSINRTSDKRLSLARYGMPLWGQPGNHREIQSQKRPPQKKLTKMLEIVTVSIMCHEVLGINGTGLI